ncbi:MAG: hypothetical protein KAW93_08700 [Methanogenium sp.]|nr:hypothetical protein [Methanogenium sp.]
MKKNNPVYTRYLATILLMCIITGSVSALSAQVSQPILPKGISLSITGQADYDGEIAVWIIGQNFQERRIIATRDGVFKEELFSPKSTSELQSGQYFLIIEDTGSDSRFAVNTTTVNELTKVYYQNMPLFALNDPDTSYTETAMKLSEVLNRPDIDDRTINMLFLVEEPWMKYDQIPVGHQGDLLRFSGSTNLPPGHRISYSISPAFANPEEKNETTYPNTTEVVKGLSHNYWYFDIDTCDLKSREYIATVDSGLANVTTTFTIYDEGDKLPDTPQITVETLQNEPEVISSQSIGQELLPAETMDNSSIAKTSELIYTTDCAVIWCSAIDGEYAVWAERTENEKTNIYLYHIPTGTTHKIIEQADYLTLTMDISGDHVAWEICRPEQSTISDNIGLYTISTDVIEELSVDKCLIAQIAMSGDLIVFSGLDFSPIQYDDKQGLKNTIFLYSLANRTQQILCKQPGHQKEPAIGEGYVVWLTLDNKSSVTIHSLYNNTQILLTPPDGAEYGTPSVGGGMMLAPLHWRNKTSGTYKTEIVTMALHSMETETLPLPEIPRRYNPQSNGAWIIWAEEREMDSSGGIMISNKDGTILEPFCNSRPWHSPKIDQNHIIARESDELRGINSLWLTTLTGEEQHSPGEKTVTKNPGEFPGKLSSLSDASVFGVIMMIGGIIAVSIILGKRRSR